MRMTHQRVCPAVSSARQRRQRRDADVLNLPTEPRVERSSLAGSIPTLLVTFSHTLPFMTALATIPSNKAVVTYEHPEHPKPKTRGGWSVAALLLVLIVGIPQFLRMPLTNDAILFDLQARLLGEGDVLYRDILEPNFPGVVWIHRAVRAVGGTSTEALRTFDLLLLSITLMATYLLSQKVGANRAAGIWIVAGCALFYLGASEWIHCQRDTWMLAPILVAGYLRLRAVEQAHPSRLMAVIEGLIWGCGVWIKPYVLLIGAACWVTGLVASTSRKRYLIESIPLVLGGIIVGVAGVGWLMATGAWPAFIETLRVWNPKYLAAGRTHWTLSRFNSTAARMAPWFWLHLLAVPIAVTSILNLIRKPTEPADQPQSTRSLFSAGLAAIYLASLAHGFGLQHLFDYVHGPLVLLAVVVTGTWVAKLPQRKLVTTASCLFLVLAVRATPLRQIERLKLWPTCVTTASTVETQDRLAHFTNPRRADMERIAEFLEQRGAGPREVCGFNSDCVWLYERLRSHPPTRFVYFYEIAVYLPEDHQTMLKELAASHHRYVVSDLLSLGMSRADAEAVGRAGPQGPPPKYPRQKNSYPWSHPVIYRSGSYLVHEVREPLGELLMPQTSS